MTLIDPRKKIKKKIKIDYSFCFNNKNWMTIMETLTSGQVVLPT